jgi:hypothetical protein
VLRKGICAANLTIHVKQYEGVPACEATDETPAKDAVVYMDIDTVLSGLKGTQEERHLDGSDQPHEDWLFGKVVAQSRFVDNAALQGAVKEAWGAFGSEGWIDEGVYILSTVQKVDKSWNASQVWGFMMIEGERRYCRKNRIVAGDKSAEINFVFDWVENAK